MDNLHLIWLVLLLGFTVVAPVILLVVDLRGLGSHTLSEWQRQTREKELREAGIVRDGEEWEGHDLDELMLNLRRYEQWRGIGTAVTILLTAGVATVALIAAAGGLADSSAYMRSASVIWFGSVALGMSVGGITSDRRFAAREGTLPMPHADAIFSGVGGILRRPWWVGVLDAGLTVGVSACALLYAIGRGGTLENAATNLAVARHPWLIWCIPAALWMFVVTRELMVRWETRRPPVRLTEQPELAGRADLHLRRKACKWFSEGTLSYWIWLLSLLQIGTFEGLVDSSIETLLLIIAFGALIVGALTYGVAESRRKRQQQGAGDVGLRGEA